ncbi:MAG TPA: hypothetical protein PKC89_08380 [Pyrinomonadaceae bacterium]|nr:hypothetical protein [Pyrinomonadaceae bacterium]
MKLANLLLFTIALSVSASAQFNSGSTGADGALDTATMTCPSNVCEVQLPPSGVLNYTTVNVEFNKILRFKQNSRNTAVLMLAQGDVTIAGTIDVSNGNYVPCNSPSGRCFDYRLGGPGGFSGGQGGSNGFGPGGGISGSGNGRVGTWVGPISLVPLVGGSGGADGGDGGAGAILIASSTSIRVSGQVSARVNARCNVMGSGGAIRLVSNSIIATGSFDASGGVWGSCIPVSSGSGVVRLEATNLTFSGTSSPAAILSPINPNIGTSALAQLTITSVGGYVVPSYAGTRFDTVDILLPNSIPDPVNVVVQGVNIPSGTQVQVGFVSGSPSGTSTACTLTGGPGPVSCTATVSNLNRTGVTYLLATAAFTPPTPLVGFNPNGADHIAKVKLESVLGAKQRYVFLRADNSVIETAKVPKEFLLYYGM